MYVCAIIKKTLGLNNSIIIIATSEHDDLCLGWVKVSLRGGKKSNYICFVLLHYKGNWYQSISNNETKKRLKSGEKRKQFYWQKNLLECLYYKHRLSRGALSSFKIEFLQIFSSWRRKKGKACRVFFYARSYKKVNNHRQGRIYFCCY